MAKQQQETAQQQQQETAQQQQQETAGHVKDADESASLANLEALAAETAPGAITPEELAEQEALNLQVTAEQSLAGLLQVAAMGAGMVGYRRVAGVWTENNCLKFSQAAVPVFRKYPWGQSILAFLESGTGAEEMALLAVAAPLVGATVQAVRADAAEMAKPVEGGSDGKTD